MQYLTGLQNLKYSDIFIVSTVQLFADTLQLFIEAWFFCKVPFFCLENKSTGICWHFKERIQGFPRALLQGMVTALAFQEYSQTWGMIVILERRSWRPILVMSTWSTLIVPVLGSMIRKRASASVDLPAPVLPTRPIWKHPGRLCIFF